MFLQIKPVRWGDFVSVFIKPSLPRDLTEERLGYEKSFREFPQKGRVYGVSFASKC